MKHVRDTDHETNQQPHAWQLREGGPPDGLERAGVFPDEPGRRRDPERRRFDLEFRDEGCTATVIASGPSASGWSRDELGRFPAITINDSYKLHPCAEGHYAADPAWWKIHGDTAKALCWREAETSGTKASRHFCSDERTCYERRLEHRTVLLREGLSREHYELCAGGTVGNSGAQAINLAYLAGARRILLVGFDMRSRVPDSPAVEHFFGPHPPGLARASDYTRLIEGMWKMAYELSEAGVEVLNFSRHSALPYWPRLERADFPSIGMP